MASGVCVAASRCQTLFRIDYRRFGLHTLSECQRQQHFGTETWSRRERRYASSSSNNNFTTPSDPSKCSPSGINLHKSYQRTDNSGSQLAGSDTPYVTVKYVRGLPHVVVPLPSRTEKCQFALRPITHNVGDFLQMIRAEDKGIDRATILNSDGVRIAAASSIESLLDEEFWLQVNDKKYLVQPPPRKKLSIEESSQVGDVRALVAQLYQALNVEEHQIQKERELSTRLEELNMQLQPLEKAQEGLMQTTERKTEMLTWVGLGMMGVQFGILARLTWWEYSWDIMEPVTYFVTYGTAMATYAYYCLTKQEYNLPEVKDRQYLITMHKKARKHGFDIDQYNLLRRQYAEVEHDLRRLRDPLYFRYANASTERPCQEGYDQTSVPGVTPSTTNSALPLSPRAKIASIIENASKKLKK